AASGEWIAPLDADDLWDPTKIKRQVLRFRECGAQTSTVYTWWVWIDANGLVLDRSPRWRIEGRALNELVEVNFTGSASVPMYRLFCVEEVGGYSSALFATGCQGGGAGALAFGLGGGFGVSFVPAVLVAYRRRADSMSTSREAMWRSRAAVMEDLATRQPALP